LSKRGTADRRKKKSLHPEDKPMTTHRGNCHCGQVTFEVDGEVDSALASHCSNCSRRGSLLWFVPRHALRLTTPEANLASYTFNKHVIKHRFCPRCGMHPFGEGTDPKGNAMAAVNLRCVEGLDLNQVPVHHYDGRSM
jgi:hypothetical protein